MTTIEQLKQLGLANGLTLVVRGTQYARLMRGDEKLVVFRVAGWEPAANAWIDGWVQSQKAHAFELIQGRVEVDGRDIKYFWVVSATIATAFRAEADKSVIEHVGYELKQAATRGQMLSLEDDGGLTTRVHGWWWSGDEEEVLQEKQDAASAAHDVAIRAYLYELGRVCQTINFVYDAANAAGEKCSLERAGTSMGKINSRSECRYQWVAVHLSEGGRKHTIRLAPKFVGGTGAGKYTLNIIGRGERLFPDILPASLPCTEITVPPYPEIAESLEPHDD